MFVMDVPPDVPQQYAPVLVAEAPKTPAPASRERTIGVCKMLDGRIDATTEKLAVNAFSPSMAAGFYFRQIEKIPVGSEGKTTLLQGPAHGELKVTPSGNYRFFPASSDYFGPDQATFLVEIGEYKVKLVYHFRVMPGVGGGDYSLEKDYCPNGGVWRISLNPDDPNAPIYTFEYPSQLTSPYAGLANVNLTFGTFAPGALGQATGDTITLDPSAAGFGWFIDSTPWSNEEFLPTHDPDMWVAREDSDAVGRMDLLSVLLHEYGHVLGIDLMFELDVR